MGKSFLDDAEAIILVDLIRQRFDLKEGAMAWDELREHANFPQGHILPRIVMAALRSNKSVLKSKDALLAAEKMIDETAGSR